MLTLPECLRILHNNLSQESSAVCVSEQHIKEIEQLCARSLTKYQLGLYCSLLFENNKGILPVLKNNVTSSQRKSIRDLILTFLSTFVPRVGMYVQPYIKDVRSACIDIFRRDRYSKNRDKALQIIIQLVSHRYGEDEDWIKQLVKTLFEELAKTSSNTTSTVRGHSLHALGTIAHYHPGHMTQYSDRLYEIFLRDLKKETSSHKDDLKIIEGALNGINSLMFSFTSAYDEEPIRCQEIYNYARMSIQPQTTLSRFSVPLAGMQLLRDHASQLGDLLIDDYRGYYGALENWFNHKNYNLKHTAHMAIESFLTQVALSISKGERNPKSEELFMFFIKKFKAMLKSEKVHSKTMSLAIKGYGLFAAPCKRYLSNSDVCFMFSEIMNRCEQLYLSNESELDDNRLHQLPSFISSLSKITRQIETKTEGDDESCNLSDSFMTSMQRLCVLMIERYPRLHRKFSKYCLKSLSSAVSAFVEKPEVMKKFQASIAYQGLIRSCSHAVLLGEDREKIIEPDFQINNSNLTDGDVMNDVMKDTRTVTYKDYCPLWISLLAENDSYSRSGESDAEVHNYMNETFLSAFVNAVMDIISKLDLTINSSKNDNITVDDTSTSALSDNLQASNAMDFKIFINLVDLCLEIFPKIAKKSAGPFPSHIHQLVQHLVAQSTRMPLVSGFYKLLAVIMNISTQLSYFSCITQSPASASSLPVQSFKSMDIEDGLLINYLPERKQCLIFLQKYALEVISRLKQFKDDLLASCLRFILSLPIEIASDILQQLVPAIQRACQLGTSYTPLAEATLTALERWRLSSAKHKSILSEIVPYLEPFLNSAAKEQTVQRNVKIKKTKSFIEEQKSLKEAEEPARKKIRSQVIKFLGSLGGDASAWVKKSKTLNTDHDNAVALWDKEICIDYSIPFRDMKPVIRLDCILPHIMKVAEQAGGRQAKVAECELLHSITLYIIGRSAQAGNVKSVQPMTALYKKLFPVIFKLACDVDQVCKQMFEPLVNQIIHWFTNNRQFESLDTTALLNTMMDGLVDEDDASLRELCAQSISEFLTWSIKQNTNETGKGRNNAKSLFKRIKSFALHPSCTKRLGATLAFNHLYRVFREQDALVDEFIFELFVIFMDCLALAHSDDRSTGTEKSCVLALQHLERIVKGKSLILNKPSTTRRTPRGIIPSRTNTSVVLIDVVSWLFEQCGRPQTECRHQCMRLFCEFVKLLPYENKLASTWIQKKIEKNGVGFIISKFEGGCDGNGITAHPHMTSLSDKFSVKTASLWFDLVLAAIETYSWVFQEKLMTPSAIWTGKQTSNLYQSLIYFMQKVARVNIMDVAKKIFATTTDDLAYTPQERTVYERAKCTMTTRILQFINLLFKQHARNAIKFVPASLLEKDALFDLVAIAVISPYKLGFDTFNDNVVTKNLSELSMELLKLLLKNLHEEHRNTLLQSLKMELFMHGKLTDILPVPFGNGNLRTDDFNIFDMIRGYIALRKCDVLNILLTSEAKDSDDYLHAFARYILKLVFESVVSSEGRKDGLLSVNLSPNDIKLGRALMMLALAVGVPADNVVECLYNKSELLSADTGISLATTHGRMFVSTYSEQIYKEMCHNSSVYIPLITRQATDDQTCSLLLLGMLEYLASNRLDRKKYATIVCDAILMEWDRNLKCWWVGDGSNKLNNDKISNLLATLKKIIALDADVCKSPSHKAFNVVFKMYTELLKCNELTLAFKTEALDLLSFFTLSHSHLQELKSSLETLVVQHFPLNSREFQTGTSSYNDYVSAMRKLLLALQVSGSLALLEIVISIFCREEDHILTDEIQEALEKATKCIPLEDQKNALSIPYSFFADSSRYSVTFRRLAITNVLVPMSVHCDVTANVEFFTSYINDIMTTIKEERNRYPESKWQEQLYMKCLAYRLMELMFTVLPEHQVIPSSPIGHAYADVASQSTESLLKSFMTRANRDRNESMKHEKILLEERRKFHCAVYNAMIAAVICTQTKLPWYKAFLFDENVKKNQYFLDNVVDAEVKYFFAVEMSEPLKKRKRFVAIRKKLQDEQEDNFSGVNYMASIAGSSLSEDVSVFDGNASRTIPRSSLAADNESAMDTTDGEGDSQTSVFRGNFIELEADRMNQHECMPSLVALITHMYQNSIGFPLEDDQSTTLPLWMVSLHKKFVSTTTHKNVRIFIAKLIINCEPFFRRYAVHWIVPLVQTVLHGDFGSNGINSMVCDVMATVLSWNSISIPEDSVEGRNLVQGIVTKLSENIQSDNRAIVRHNLDLIKTTLECWGNRIENGIDPSVVYHLCNSSDPESKANFAGLQLIGALLANGVAPYTSSYTVDRLNYFERLFRNIQYNRKEIYDSASEVAGMTLKHLTDIEREIDGEIHALVANKLTLLCKDESKQDKFVTCLHKVALHYAKIVDKFKSRIFFLLPKMHGDLRTNCFEIIMQRAEAIPDLYVELKSKDLVSILAVGDETLQLVCLRLCHRILYTAINQKSESDPNGTILYFLPALSKHFSQHPSPVCRQEALEIAMDIYDFQQSLPSSSQNQHILSTVKLFILKSLSDSEEVLRNQVVNFWNLENRIPIEPCSKLSSLLGDLYDPSLDEVQFLSNTVCLLLQSASLSPDFERPLFEHPLSECVFQEYSIDHSWKHRHAGMTPMFVDTLQSMAGSPNERLSPTKQSKPNMVMATQDQLQFSATVSSKNTYNWMTGNSLDTFSSINPYGSEERKSSLLVNAPSKKSKAKLVLSTLKPGPGFGKTKLSTSKNDEAENSQGVDVDVQRLRQRFTKETEDSRIKFARVQEMKRKKQELAKKDQRSRQENEVQLHRKYRSGELPDVQIPNRSIIAPLAAACQHDPTLSQLLMSSLVSAVMKEELKMKKKDSNAKILQICEHLANILRSSQEKNPSLVGFIEDVAFHAHHDAEFNQLDASDVASASLAADKQALGIAVLEQYIIDKQHSVPEPSVKRRKITQVESRPDAETWVELARLYKSLDEFDMLQGIFAGHLGSSSATAEGLSLEGNGKYNAACKVYQQALEKDWENDVSEVEKDLWEDCLLNSLRNLSRWDQVNKMCSEHLTSYEDTPSDSPSYSLQNAWNYTDYQQRYLDSALHAKLLLLLQCNVDVGEELRSFMDDAMREEGDKRALIERKYLEYLTMLYIYNGDYDRARYYLHKGIDHFSVQWSSLNPLMVEKREELLQIIPRFSDIQDFLSVTEKTAHQFTSQSIQKLISKWLEQTLNPVYDPVTAWFDSITYRCFFIDELWRKFESSSASDDALFLWMEKSKFKMKLKLVENAYHQNNFSLASRMLNKLDEGYDIIESDKLLCLKLSHTTATCYLTQARHQVVLGDDNKPSFRLQCLLAAYESLNDQNQNIKNMNSDHAITVEHFSLLAATYDMASDKNFGDADDDMIDRVKAMTSADDVSDLRGKLQNQAYTLYTKAAHVSSQFTCNTEQELDLQYKSYMALAEFCDKQIRGYEETSTECSLDNASLNELAIVVTQYVLKSMLIHGGSRSIACLRFPRLLQLVEKFQNVIPTFVKEAANVPSWMFLAWTGHIVALLDKEFATSLHALLGRMAQDYPQAIVYPVKTAMKGFDFAASDNGKKKKAFVKKLQCNLLRAVPLADEFIRQLQLVADPVTRFKDWTSDLDNLIGKKEVNTNDVMEHYQNMYIEIFGSSNSEESALYGTPTTQPARTNTGLLWSKFAKKYKSDIDRIFGGSTGNKLPCMTKKNLKSSVAKLINQMSAFKNDQGTLKDYSHWLASFQPLLHGDNDLEIPGQYDGRSKPLLDYHKTIVGFDERIRVMSSIRKPCQITIRGSDAKEYGFLVKGGEDLRQDQRIEQIFEAINDLLQEDTECRKRNLFLMTYQVIPVSSKVGLIEWVENVLPYFEFISAQSKRMNCAQLLQQLRKTEWVPDNVSHNLGVGERYGKLMKYATYTDVVNKFNKTCARLPSNILREAYIHIVSNPESFLTLRKRFVTTYAVICITHWLLGIGDRHTLNFLISTATGCVLGIDFGHAFGSATEVLPVPELMPFRLTRQLVGLLAPHEAKRGEFRQVMVRCLSALRIRSDALLPLLDVFIKDPSVDWLRFAKRSRDSELRLSKQPLAGGDHKQMSDKTWYAQRKMQIVKRKLGGGNPAPITCDELEHNAGLAAFRKYYCSVAKGDPSHGNRRAKETDDDLSVEAQVDCLLDQASDPNILGRTWKGWNSWL